MIRFIRLLTIVSFLTGCAVPVGGQPGEPTLPPVATALGVVTDGSVVPAADVTLRFERTGSVAEILVTEGDSVEAGQLLARLDTRRLELQVLEARAGLDRAQAHYDQIAAGASPEVIAVAELGVTQAESRLAEVRAGVTAADSDAAEAQLAEARAALAALEDGPTNSAVMQAQAGLEQAQAGLQQQRDALSAAKTVAQAALEQAANALRERQQTYQRIVWDNAQLDDPSDERIDREASALRAVEDGEAQLTQARVLFEQAQRAEAVGIVRAEAGVREAQARLEQLTAQPGADRLAAARARIAAAEAALDQVRGAGRAAQLDAAAVGVRQARAQLNLAAAAPREIDLAVARSEIAAARIGLDRAVLELEQATLTAPFAGTVVQIDLDRGALTGPDSAAIILADLRSWRVETDDLTELEVVRLQVGDTVTVRFDALPDLELAGTVQQISPIGTDRQGDIVYTATVTLEQHDPRLRWNMTAVISSDGSR